MFNKNIGIAALSIGCLLTQVGCMTTGTQSSSSIASNEHAISSDTERQIMKEATVAGTIGGVLVSAILVEKYGKDWPLELQLITITGGTFAAQAIAKYIAMEQIATLNDVTLENDRYEKLLAEARKVNNDYAQLNEDLKASIEVNKNYKQVLQDDLEKAKANKSNVDSVLKERRLMLDMLVKNSEQYNEYAEEVEKLENEKSVLESIINELNELTPGLI